MNSFQVLMKLSTQMVASAGFVIGKMMRKMTEEAKKLLRQNLKMYAVAKLVGTVKSVTSVLLLKNGLDLHLHNTKRD